MCIILFIDGCVGVLEEIVFFFKLVKNFLYIIIRFLLLLFIMLICFNIGNKFGVWFNDVFVFFIMFFINKIKLCCFFVIVIVYLFVFFVIVKIVFLIGFIIVL